MFIPSSRELLSHEDPFLKSRLFLRWGDKESFDRCFAKRRNSQERCKRKRQKGSKFCGHHRRRYVKKEIRSISSLPSFYSKQLNKTLQDKLREMTNGTFDEQLNLTEELGLFRILASEAVLLWSKANELPNPDNPDHPAGSTAGYTKEQLAQYSAIRNRAAINMEAQLRQVVEVAERVARVNTLSNKTISVTNLQLLVNQLIVQVYDVLKSHPHLAQQLEEKIRTKIKISDDNTTGITEDMFEMLHSIPKDPDADMED